MIELRETYDGRSKGYRFYDTLSMNRIGTELFGLKFYYATLDKEAIDELTKLIDPMMHSIVDTLNGVNGEGEIENTTFHERLSSLEEEIAELTNIVSGQTTKHGTLHITPHTMDMDFNKDGTMLKFINADNGVYTTGILKDNTSFDLVLPVGTYTINIVNTLNDTTDSIFSNISQISDEEINEDEEVDTVPKANPMIISDDKHSATCNVLEGEESFEMFIEYENI